MSNAVNHAARLKIALNKSLSLDQRKRFLESIIASGDCPGAIYAQAEAAYNDVLHEIDGGQPEQSKINREARDHSKHRKQL